MTRYKKIICHVLFFNVMNEEDASAFIIEVLTVIIQAME